jgi:hypothetical protein
MKRVAIVAAALVLCAALAGAQASQGAITVSFMPAVSFPLAYWNASLPPGFYNLTLSATVDGEYPIPFLPILFAKGGITYRRAPLSAGPVLTLLEASAGIGAKIGVAPKIGVKPYVAGGYQYGFLNTGGSGGAWTARAGANVQFDFFAPLGIVVGAAAVMDGGAFLGIQAGAGVSYSFGPPTAVKAPAEKPEKQKPEKLAPKETPPIPTKPTEAAGGLTLKAEFDQVFPVFYSWYESNPLGTLTLKNAGKDAITGVTVSFFIQDYMRAAMSTSVPDRLDPGKELVVPLKALFNEEKILSIDTGKKELAQITVDYQVGNDRKQVKLNESVALEGRNGMNWLDDRHAAAFVTYRDEPVITFARNVWSAVQSEGSRVIDENLRKAMAMHEALRLYRMVYSKDPQTPYTGKKGAEVDFLQFPRQTLRYKAGDCDDLSILYCALLQALGVDTAFITVPGHIYAAVVLADTPAVARSRYRHPGDLIFTETAAWAPVEVTKLGTGDDFVEAWATGAKEWSDAQSKKAAALIPVREAQGTFKDVNLPRDNWVPAVPAGAALAAKYKDVTIRFLDGEMSQQLAELNKRVKDSNSDPKALNALGVLYAKYGRYAEAQVQFKKAAEKSNKYISPLLNLGMIDFIDGKNDSALDYYTRAKNIDPSSSLAWLGIARANHALENYGAVRTALTELKRVDMALATEYAYLELTGDEAAKAAEASGAKESAEWAEQ